MSEPVEEGTPAPSRRANPTLAGLFSLFWPGIGQLYAGNPRKAAAFVIGLPLASAFGLALVVTIPVPGVNLLPLLLSLGLHLAAIVDAVREARRPRVDGGRAWYGRWYVCVSLIVLGALVWRPVQAAALRTSVAQAFRIPTGGMEPTVQIGDHLYASKFAYGLRNPFTKDSRYWGFLPLTDVTGQARVVYFATGDGTRQGLERGFKIRWNRMGMILR